MIDTWADYTMRSIKVSKVGIIWVQSSEPDKRGVLFFQLIFISQLLWYEWAIEFTPSSNWTCMYKATLLRFLAKLEFRYSLENCSYVYNISYFLHCGIIASHSWWGYTPCASFRIFLVFDFPAFQLGSLHSSLELSGWPFAFLVFCLILTWSNNIQLKKIHSSLVKHIK